jgi:arabinofuranosyltransferase
MWLAASGLVVVVVRAAWMSDDSFITLRTIDNFWRGYGLRWNVIERVQAYTHPLWMLLVGACYGVTREPYFTTLAVSGACLLAQIAIVIRRLAPPQALLALTALMCSRAYVDFSTSGLENPLSHLLLTAFCVTLLTGETGEGGETGEAVDTREAPAVTGQTLALVRRYRTLAWLSAACVLTRMDLALLVGPALLVETWRLGLRRALPHALLAALPVAGWHAFTLIYYGSLVPNTALAKLPAGVPRSELLQQGLWYLRDSWRTDYVTMPFLCAALGYAAWRVRRAWPLAIGMLASLAYVVTVGGDFMSGRFLTVLGVCAVLIVAQLQRFRQPRLAATAAAIVFAIGAIAPHSPLAIWRQEPEYHWMELLRVPDMHGIVDERRVYEPDTGLVRVLLDGAGARDSGMGRWGRSLGLFPNTQIQVSIGFFGYYGGPPLHPIDLVGLSEPFLARLPATVTFGGRIFRPGHYGRTLPAGYRESVDACVNHVMPHGSFAPNDRTCVEPGDAVNLVKDPKLHALLADVTLVTQGRLFTAARWQAIWRLATRLPQQD